MDHGSIVSLQHHRDLKGLSALLQLCLEVPYVIFTNSSIFFLFAFQNLKFLLRLEGDYKFTHHKFGPACGMCYDMWQIDLQHQWRSDPYSS